MLIAEVSLNIPLDRTFFYIIPDGMDLDRFFRLQVNFGGRKMMALALAVHEDRDISEALRDIKLKSVEKVLDAAPIMDERLFRLAEWLRDYYLCSLGEALFTILPAARNPRSFPLSFRFYDQVASLSPEQQEAFNAIAPGIGSTRSYYLHGITGSGKTEVYKHLVKQTLSQDQSVIILIPEIALTPQTLERFYHSFGQKVAVYHSKLSPGERLHEWKRCQSGEARVLIGPRSAVFLPMQRLGLIIIDEEHESSYKSNNKPRYHARQVAFYRSRNEQAALLLGSATPQLESYYHAQSGMFSLVELKNRYGNSRLPQVSIVDLRQEEKGNSLFSHSLFLAIIQALKAKQQVLLFLNRRGYSPVLLCSECGYVAQCPQCDVSLTLHKHMGLLKCHHCGYQTAIPPSCPQCHNISFKEMGSGTEKLEVHMSELFPGARVARMDLDTTRGKYQYEDILGQLKSGKVDILVGTQMIAKGHDIAAINLVGALMPDIILNVPDFRSAERAFILLTQVIGRAGRRDQQGKAYIQTYMPEHYAITMAARQDFLSFYKLELEKRRRFNYPPFTRLGRAVVRGLKPEQVKDFCSALSPVLQPWHKKDSGVEILGPVSCPMEKLNNHYRYHIILKSGSIQKINRLLSEIRDFFQSHKLSSYLFLELDIDPQNLM